EKEPHLAGRSLALLEQVEIERQTVEELHRDPRDPEVRVDPGADDLHHVIALDDRADARLLLEALTERSVGDQLALHHLERGHGAGARLLGHVHRAHSSHPQRAEDAKVATKQGPALELDSGHVAPTNEARHRSLTVDRPQPRYSPKSRNPARSSGPVWSRA